MCVHLRNVGVNVVAAMYVTPSGLRTALMRRCGVKVGPRTTVLSRCTFAGLEVSIGEGCYVSYQCVFDATAPIVIGDNVFMAHRVNIVTATHAIGDRTMRASTQRRLPVTIGRGCWLGADVTVLPGITIGDGCVIAAGAVVAADCEPDGLYAGVPARRVRDL